MRANRTLSYFAAHILKLPNLTNKEKDILSRRLRSTTLQKIGYFYKVTEARIRQIENRALKKADAKYYQQRLFD